MYNLSMTVIEYSVDLITALTAAATKCKEMYCRQRKYEATHVWISSVTWYHRMHSKCFAYLRTYMNKV